MSIRKLVDRAAKLARKGRHVAVVVASREDAGAATEELERTVREATTRRRVTVLAPPDVAIGHAFDVVLVADDFAERAGSGGVAWLKSTVMARAKHATAAAAE